MRFSRKIKNEGVMNNVSITPTPPVLVLRSPSVQFVDVSSKAVPVTENIAESLVTEINASKSKTEQPLSVDTVKAAVVAGNTLLESVNHNLQFQIDDATKQVVIKIVDSKTGELVRQIPTVEMLDFIRHMKELEGKSGSILSGQA